MFLRKTSTTINGKEYSHYKIVESYRKNGKVKQRTVLSLGSISEDKAEKIKLVLSINKDTDIIVTNIENIIVTNHKAYLDIVFLHFLWEKWAFNTFFHSDHWVEAMVLNRIIDPCSKIAIKDWTLKTVLPVITTNNISIYNEFDVYRVLDRLNTKEKEVQLFLYGKLLKENIFNTSTLFYDITTTYFEGSKCILAEYGFSKDIKSGKQQIQIALMVSREGYPFYWKVLKGKTKEVSTVKDLVDEIRNRFHIDHFKIVFDRGISSEENISYINDNKLDYITALGNHEIRTLEEYRLAMPEPVMKDDYDIVLAMNEFVPVDENNLLYYREFKRNGRRFIFVFDVARFQDERKNYKERIKSLIKWISEKNEELKTVKIGRKHQVVEREISVKISKNKLKRIIDFAIVPIIIKRLKKNGIEREFPTYRIDYKINNEAEHEEMKMDGLWCFISNVPENKNTAADLFGIYRQKNKIEDAFHEIKAHINIRPILLSRPGRVKAHVTVCVLAYFLYNDIEMMLKKNNIDLSTEKLMKEFEGCKANQISVLKDDMKKYDITKPNSALKDILNKIGLNSLIDKKYYNKIMKKLV